MQKEKIAVIALVIIIIGALSTVIVLQPNEEGTGTILDDIIKNLFAEKPKIEDGDCADIHYTGRYASNNTVFDTSYEDVAKEWDLYDEDRDYEPLNIFVTMNKTVFPPEGYDNYDQGIIDGLMEGLIGLKEGDKKTVGPISPEKAYGLKPRIGDILNLTPYFGFTSVYKFIEVQEDAPMPEEYQLDFGNGTTTLYTLREDWHYIDELIDTYPFWENSTVVTKINETMLWKYTTPTTDVGEGFTWSEVDLVTGTQTTFPENASSISSINDTTIAVTHSPEVNETIEEVSAFGYMSTSYTVESVTVDIINASTTDDETGNKTYKEFDRTTTIQRNETQNITFPQIPGEALEGTFAVIRSFDSDFKLSYGPLAGETLYFDVEIVEVYKTSQLES